MSRQLKASGIRGSVVLISEPGFKRLIFIYKFDFDLDYKKNNFLQNRSSSKEMSATG
jgi:hypothetical protein